MKLFFSLLFFFLPICIFAQQWEAVGPLNGPTFFRVHDIVKFEGDLIIGGEFDSINSGYDRVARLHNGQWEPVGSGIKHNSPVIAWETGVHLLENYNGQLIAGGYFYNLDGLLIHMVQWDGNDWIKVKDTSWAGNGVNSSTYYQGELYLGGQIGFISIIGNNDGCVARWDGNELNLTGPNITNIPDNHESGVHALAASNGKLYAGGNFWMPWPHISYAKGHNIAAWDGTQWDTLPERLNGPVTAMAHYNGALYVGGEFTKAGNKPMLNMTRWDGNEWSYTGADFLGYGHSLRMTVYDRKLYVSGWARTATGDTLGPGILTYDGTNWEVALDNFTSVEKLRVIDSVLYAVGTFDSMAGLDANSVAAYRSPTVSIDKELSERNEVKIFPNPINEQLFLQIPSSLLNERPFFRIRDILGKEIRSFPVRHPMTHYSLSFLPAGAYLVEVYSSYNTFRKIIYKH